MDNPTVHSPNMVVKESIRSSLKQEDISVHSFMKYIPLLTSCVEKKNYLFQENCAGFRQVTDWFTRFIGLFVSSYTIDTARVTNKMISFLELKDKGS